MGSTASHALCAEKPVLITILRAGLPLCYGVHKIFSDSEVGYLGMARNEETLQPKTDYIAIPNVRDKCVIIIDTMIATGGSILDAIRIVEKQGPKKIIVIGAIAAEAGIAKIVEYNPNIKIYAAAIDPQLNEKGYIIPGLGDAGDRCYGQKE
ncbi:MAG: uracil phosphoribosyltransferase [Chlamydiae bacterium]|nr:uracil phosphoribosyltransferase [Chlamydiota bacterium]